MGETRGRFSKRPRYRGGKFSGVKSAEAARQRNRGNQEDKIDSLRGRLKHVWTWRKQGQILERDEGTQKVRTVC